MLYLWIHGTYKLYLQFQSVTFRNVRIQLLCILSVRIKYFKYDLKSIESSAMSSPSMVRVINVED